MRSGSGGWRGGAPVRTALPAGWGASEPGSQPSRGPRFRLCLLRAPDGRAPSSAPKPTNPRARPPARPRGFRPPRGAPPTALPAGPGKERPRRRARARGRRPFLSLPRTTCGRGRAAERPGRAPAGGTGGSGGGALGRLNSNERHTRSKELRPSPPLQFPTGLGVGRLTFGIPGPRLGAWTGSSPSAAGLGRSQATGPSWEERPATGTRDTPGSRQGLPVPTKWRFAVLAQPAAHSGSSSFEAALSCEPCISLAVAQILISNSCDCNLQKVRLKK